MHEEHAERGDKTTEREQKVKPKKSLSLAVSQHLIQQMTHLRESKRAVDGDDGDDGDDDDNNDDGDDNFADDRHKTSGCLSRTEPLLHATNKQRTKRC